MPLLSLAVMGPRDIDAKHVVIPMPGVVDVLINMPDVDPDAPLTVTHWPLMFWYPEHCAQQAVIDSNDEYVPVHVPPKFVGV